MRKSSCSVHGDHDDWDVWYTRQEEVTHDDGSVEVSELPVEDMALGVPYVDRPDGLHAVHDDGTVDACAAAMHVVVRERGRPRSPVRLVPARSGGLRPVSRGERRLRDIHRVRLVVRGLVTQDRRGRSAGHGITDEDRRKINDAMRDEIDGHGRTVTFAAAEVAERHGWSARTVQTVWWARDQPRDRRRAEIVSGA